jgi:NAD(P)-dependent dehydrogenase (short-subunit alcohol dehydrogenase family)
VLADDADGAARRTRGAIVVGGASGVGKAICEVLARDGYRVVVADRDEINARAVADGIDGFAVAVDITDEKAIASLFLRALEILGQVDALVTSAGIVDATALFQLTSARFARVHAVNVIGTFACIREAAMHMPRGSRICTVPAVGGRLENYGQGALAYASGIGALVALTRAAAAELAPRGIAVNGVIPNMAAYAEPYGTAEVAAFLLSPQAVALNGAILDVDQPG